MNGSLRTAVLTLAGALLLQLLFIGSYVGALHDPRPHDVPIGVAGPPAVAAKLKAELSKGGQLDPRVQSGRAAALRAIEQRETYGSVVVTGERTATLLTAAAAGPALATSLATILPPKLDAAGLKTTHEEVKPLPAGDPRGLSSFYLVVGWVVGGYLGATILGLARGTAAGSRRLLLARLGALGAYALLSGLLGCLVVEGLIGALSGAWLAVSLVGALVVLAVALATAAIQRFLGVLGTALAILLFVVAGNPASGGPFPRELLPGFWGTIGGYLPPGAGTDLLRNVVYFDGNAIAGPLLVLVAWTLVSGIVLVAAGPRPGGTSPDEELMGAAAAAA
jgi:hypothetical protein